MKSPLPILLLVLSFALPSSAATLFGLVDTGELFASADGGVTWTIQSTLPVSTAVDIAAGETPSELYMATSAGVLYRSTDAGVNWNAAGTVTGNEVVSMLIRPSGDIFLLGVAGTVWRSADDGATFSTVATLTASNHMSLTDDWMNNIYALTETGEVARSSDDGVSWTTVGVITSSSVVEMRDKGSDLFALTATGDIAKSSDQGVSWTMVGTASQVNMTGMTLDGGDLVITSKEGLVATSTDGTTWSWVGSINQLDVMALGNDAPSVTGIGPTTPSFAPRGEIEALWPNPQRANGDETSITFSISEASTVLFELYDVTGRRVAARGAEDFATPGTHTVGWSIPGLASGTYFLKMTTGAGAPAQSKLTVVR